MTSFWRRQRFAGQSLSAAEFAHTEFARWCRAAREVAHLLMSGDFLTPLGRRFVARMAHTLEEWSQDPMPPSAQRAAHRMLDEHRSQFDISASR
jgi:hypothetical protein